MAPRCTGGPPAFLPFLYPSLFLSKASRLGSSVTIRHHITETSTPDATSSSSRLNPSPDDYHITNFADKAKLKLFAGSGGRGCISFARDAYLPDGPPNGGDGGHGGSIYIQAAYGETSLHKLARRQFFRAPRGANGQGSSRSGRRGEDIIITVPVGTVVREISREDPEAEDELRRRAARTARRIAAAQSEQSENDPTARSAEDTHYDNPEIEKWVLYPGISSSQKRKIWVPDLPKREKILAQPPAPIQLDLSRPTRKPILLAAGALGGLGNPHFVSREIPRPLYATTGDKALSMEIELELKLLADVGLVGLPNAGKSTLTRALTNSRARVGAWAFTTLQPNIGTVVLDNHRGQPIVKSYHRQEPDETWEGDVDVRQRTNFTVADIPGLIEGAHLDRGLGIAFLRHVERAGVLAFVIDLSAGNAVEALKSLWNEVGLYAQMREEEAMDREREARIEYDLGVGADRSVAGWGLEWPIHAEYPSAPENQRGLHIAAKPWFVIGTKGDLPGAKENFKELREYLTKVSNGDEPHPSGIEGAWIKNCAAIPVSAIKGQGMERIVHWTVGLLDD
ncbi:P-loop containing nucleoside triphosphate hydrolase protein [Coniella lustricola]|uniref:P-loop containing nucleoside triphosphate hydrolase protein n=1 Tax=Coniella lustricola TaxID=2025994 RepID=A0A2T3A6C2_9PEZI|nr:P-loop containing nucleoside triphosphate hydrolase protein [Coniella lustricola]